MKDKVKRGGRNQIKTDVTSLQNSYVANNAIETKGDEDTSFLVKIQGQGLESFELQVHRFWLVQDAILALLSRNEVRPRSSLSLSLAGTVLDPFAELQSLKGLKSGAIFRLVEEPYTSHSARVHLARIVDLLRASGPQDALREGHSPSVLETLTHTQAAADSTISSGKGLKRSASNTKTESSSQDGAPPEYLLPGSSERPLMALLPHSSQPMTLGYLKDLSLSCWNPPPGHRKMQGDFMYITVVTMEGRRHDITSSPKGFFINRSTEDAFDPRPAQSSSVCHCFSDLLCQISPAFKQAFTTLKNRPQQPEFEAMPTHYYTLSWLGPPCASRIHKNNFSRLGVDEQASPQAPDWNEELQAARDLPQGSLENRLQRDKTLLQVNSEFVRTVMQGAEAVRDGFVEPVNGNPEDPAFLWNGLFLSQGATSAVYGGERGRRAAQKLELRCVQAYSDLEGLQGLHTLPTAIVDYRGLRLSAQGLAPGLESSEENQEDTPASRGLLYGVHAGHQESTQRRQLLELLAHSAKSLCLQRHVVIAPNGHKVPLFTSFDVQGLLGADGRFYLLDTFRSFPADANFCLKMETENHTEISEDEIISGSSGKEKTEGETNGWPENYQSTFGLPKSFPHGLCRLRPELVQSFIHHKHCQFTQCVREKLENNGGFEECATSSDSRSTEAVRAACKEVGSVSDIIFEMRFNPNVFSAEVSFPPSESTTVELQKRLLREAAAFIVTHQIPDFVKGCLLTNEAPMDGITLKHTLHQRGINLRYLGHLLKAITMSEHKEHLRHITRSVIGEIFTRSAKRVFNTFIQGVDVPCLSAAVSHFLSCLLVAHFIPTTTGEDSKKKSRRRGRGAGAAECMPWSMMTGTELWNLVCQDAAETYDISDSLGSSPNYLVEHYGLQKLSILREFCLKTGVQLRLRDYLLDNQNKAPISPDDILNIFPVVKHLHMPTVDASKAYFAGQTSIQKGLLDQAHEHLKQAVYLYGRVCEDLHPEACHCHSLLAKVAFQQGKAAEARSTQLKAVVISERVLGFDHPNTIQQYVLLGVYTYAGGEGALAQKCFLRARLLMLTVHGEDHPYMATVDSCLGLVLAEDKREQYLKNALKLNISFFSSTDLHTALSQHLLAQWMCSKGDYRSAMIHEKEALSAFTTLFGEDHPQTNCSKEFLSTITKQAVKVERTLRQAGSDCSEQTVECLTPNSDTVLEQMVLVTGIKRLAQSDKFQEYKQKHLERKAAARKELGIKLSTELTTDDKVSKEEKSRDGETGSEKETGDGENKATESNSMSQEEQPVDGVSVESTALASANGHVEEPAEESKQDKTDVVRAESEVTVKIANEDKVASASEEKNGEVNGDKEVITSPSVLKSKLTWADIVTSKPTTASEKESKVVNGMDDVASNGVAE